MKKEKFKRKFLKWCDGFRLSAMGIVLASKKFKFWLIFILSFVVFGTLLSLLSGGMGAVNLFFATDFSGKLKIISDGFLALFGIGRTFSDWLLIFSVSILQALLISLIVLVWKKKRTRSAKAKSQDNASENDRNSTNVQSAGIVVGLAILGSGCPTCGTALITPILGAIFSTGSYALASTISSIILVITIIIAVLSVKKVGEEAYVIMIDEEWQNSHNKK